MDIPLWKMLTEFLILTGCRIGEAIALEDSDVDLTAGSIQITKTFSLVTHEISTAKTATSIHYSVGKEVRSAIEKIGGTMPEDLPTPEKSIQEIEREQMARLKAKAKAGKLMLDEQMNLKLPLS